MKLAILLLFSFPNIAFSQSLTRTYEYTDHPQMATYRIQLLDSSRFIKSYGLWLNHGIQHLSKGSFTEKADTLILYFEPYNRPKSWMEVIKKDTMERYISPNFRRIDKSLVRLTVEVFDEDNTPTPAMVTLNSKDVKVGNIYHTEAYFTYSSENNVVTELELNALGHKALKVDLSKFRGTHSEIRVNLIPAENNTYQETYGKEKYLWRVRGEHLIEVDEKGIKGKEYLLISKN